LSGRLEDAKPILERILCENIEPFWTKNAPDPKGTGYGLNHHQSGCYVGPSEKHAIAQSRTLWFFSRLANSPYGRPAHRQLADIGFRFIQQHLWDREYGGVYWSVDPTGQVPLLDGKHLCAQVFVLYALCEYHKLADDSGALALACELFELMEDRAHDERYGGYVECFDRSWNPKPATEKSYLGPPAGLKTINTHIHVLEALSVLHDLTGKRKVRGRILEVSRILVDHAFVGRNLMTIDFQTPDWTPVGGNVGTSYGHALETIWLLLAGFKEGGLDSQSVVMLGDAVFAHALRDAFDSRNGGLYNRPRRRRKRKIWWEQAEALLSSVWMYKVTRRPVYRDVFLQTLTWVHNAQVDWVNGAWHWQPGRFGVKERAKAGQWKTPYHSGRAILDSLSILDDLGWK
jgi:mannobiose 2-epimerase